MKSGLKHFIGRVPDVSAVMARFPVPVCLMVLFAVGFSFENELSHSDRYEYLMAGLALAGYLCVSFVIARESGNKPPSLIVQVLIALGVMALAWIAKSAMLDPVMAIGASILILGNMVIFGRPRNDLRVWDFTHKIWTGVGFATLGSMIFTVGIFAIGAALQSLFSLHVEVLMLRFFLPLGLAFLAPLYWMSTIPPVDEPLSDLTDDPGFVSKSVAFLGTWIMSPLTLIYALILAAYGVKIMLAGALPKGEIAVLTTPFLLIGTLTWLLLEPPFIRDKFLAKTFRKTWFFLSIPAALLLTVSVGVRIKEYGLTYERIALILCCIWALVIGVWFCFGPKARRDIRYIPGFAAILLTFGAFTSLGLSQMSQTARAKSNLIAAGVMDAQGKVKPLAQINIIDEKAARRAHGAVEHLMLHDGEKALEKLFAGAEDIVSLEVKPDGLTYYEKEEKIFTRLKLENYSAGLRYSSNSRYEYENTAERIHLEGPGWVSKKYSIGWGEDSNYKNVLTNEDLRIVLDNRRLKITWPDEQVDANFDLHTWINSLKRNGNFYQIDQPKILLQETDAVRTELWVNSLGNTVYDDDDDEPDLYNASLGFQILITRKLPPKPNP